jgi:hypothetical protein
MGDVDMAGMLQNMKTLNSELQKINEKLRKENDSLTASSILASMPSIAVASPAAGPSSPGPLAAVDSAASVGASTSTTSCPSTFCEVIVFILTSMKLVMPEDHWNQIFSKKLPHEILWEEAILWNETTLWAATKYAFQQLTLTEDQRSMIMSLRVSN